MLHNHAHRATPERPGHAHRYAAAVAVAGLAGGSLLALGVGTAAAAPAPGRNLAICHATNSNTHPYVAETPNINAAGLAGGHAGHTGPLWNPTLKAEHIGWGDVIPPFDYTAPDGTTVHYAGMNWTAAGQAVWADGCDATAPVAPPE